ncbi:Nuclear pore complex protein NUP54 [Hondaea fermentalgiana]|uniref:Nuclear pore complex protein NUP54 n=1 Tax=Hondaea fermentalgiana TaxID=2315210 RepID=A0A2R5GQ32_9STRA|nr:Nuclear pore complex protein NUP54 [Hondaea fermentalgiana]|eukprot:GBG32409.1 Nuclear pore complex protein NUP54 [Hondaea fermentalgiana]
MFGGGTQSSGGGGLFGGASASNNNGGGGGLFGNSSNNNNNSSGGLFGNSGNNNNNNSGGGLFGSSNTSNTNTGGGLFGGSNTSNANTGGGGGLFGNSNNNNNNNNGGGGLFGGGNTTNNTGGRGGLFGSTNNNATSGGGLFGGGGGNTANNSGGGGLFGNSNNNTGSSGGLFGSSNTSNTGGGGLFGNTNTNSGGGLFGNTGTAGAFGNQQAFQQQQQQQQPQQQQMDNMNQLQNQLGAAPWWYRELSSVYNAYHVGQGSRFQTMLYEVIGMAPELMVHAGAISLSQVDYIKAQRKRMILQNNPWLDQRDYQRAEDNNPDPMNWVPTPIVGVEALHKRVEAQAAYVRSQLEMLGPSPSAASGGSASSANGSNALALIPATETKADEAKTSEQHAALWLRMDAGQGFEEQIEQCRHEHVRLKHRLIRALGRLERLQAIPQRGGRSQAELQYAERLDRLDRAMGDPRGCRAQLTQIVTQLELEDYQDAKGFGSGDLRQANNVMQEQDQEALFNFLELQREGIAKLMDIVKRDMRDLEIIKRKVHAPGAR